MQAAGSADPGPWPWLLRLAKSLPRAGCLASPSDGNESDGGTMTTTQQRSTALGPATLAELAQSVRGELLTPESDQYDDARSIWNAAHDRRPALIMRCTGVADVIK